MRIVLLTADYPPAIWSGIGVAVQRQASDLAALGCSVRAVVARPDQAVTETIEEADWIHLHSLALTELALDLRRKMGTRLAYTVHTQPWLELAKHPRRRFWLDMQARLLASCDHAVFLSAAERASAEALFRSLPPSAVIPNGVPPPPPAVPCRAERCFVVFAGRFTSSKGIALLEQCIRRVRRESEVEFLIAGGHGDREGAAVMARLAREHRCEVAGWLSREDLDARLAQALLVLVPSRYEPFGMIALEAMRMGAPVLAASVGGLRDTVRAGSGGVLLDSSDAQTWAAATLRVLRDQALWEQLHRQGPAFVDRHYRSSELAARLLREVYQGLSETGVTPKYVSVSPRQPRCMSKSSL